MQQRMITVLLLTGLLFGLITLVHGMSAWRLPDHETGYAPAQPIAYSHRLHAGELKIDCQFCHSSAGNSRHAGIPASDVCMKCHHVISSSFGAAQEEIQQAEKEKRPTKRIVSDKLQPLYKYLGLDQQLQPDEKGKPVSIPWVRVHNLPDYVYFDHRAHIHAGVTCQQCHGAVESMERVKQVENLSMGWCVNCHRESNRTGIQGSSVDASTDCTACHY